jgi:hypothetical protein
LLAIRQHCRVSLAANRSIDPKLGPRYAGVEARAFAHLLGRLAVRMCGCKVVCTFVFWPRMQMLADPTRRAEQ